MKNAEDVYPEIDISKLDLDYILFGSPKKEEICAYFARGEFHVEHYLVEAIEEHLLTEEQRKTMFENKLSIEKMLNGRYGGKEEPVVLSIEKEWNEQLGFKCFGD